MLIKNRKGAFGDETATRMPQSANVEPAVRFTNLSDLDHDGDVDIVGEAWAGEGHPIYLNDGRGYFRTWDKALEIHGHEFACLTSREAGGRTSCVAGAPATGVWSSTMCFATWVAPRTFLTGHRSA